MRGVPLDGVGLQSHFVLGRVPADLQYVMAKFAALGVEVAITELDVRFPPRRRCGARAAGQGLRIGRAACRGTPGCVGVTTWGVTDGHSWVPSFFAGYGAALPFDAECKPKPTAPAIVAAFAGAR